jgi:hypothetical protein
MKKSISFFLLIGMTLLNSCETQETVLTEQNNTISNYNTAIVNFFTDYKASLSNNKENTKKISALMQAIDYGSIKQYDLKTTEKLLVIDLKEFNFTQNATNNKLILFVNNNKIARARLVNFESQDAFNQYDDLIVSILNMDKTKLNYTGRINQFNVIQIKEYSNVFSNGTLIENGALKSKVSNSTLSRGDCTDWWWVTTYSDGSQTASYAFTSCDTCDMFDRSACAGGGTSGTGGGGGDTYSKPSFPENPTDGKEISDTDADGNFTKYRYDANTKEWVVIKNILSDVNVRRNPLKYSIFVVIWPRQGQKVVFNGLIYTYDASGTGNWEGELATNEVIAKTIEDQIDDSQLNPCQKAIMDKLKNTTVCDIAEILTKLGANKSLYNTTIKSGIAPSGKPAQTVRNSAYDYTIYISTDYAGKTKLFIAASMVHEMVHAYFMSLFDDYYNSNPPNLNAYNDFASLFDYYVTFKRPFSIDPADVSHQQMATDYVDAIARSLQEYQTGIPVSIGEYPDQIYSDLAWGGLSDAPVFDAIYPVGNPNRQRILNRYQAEGRGSTVGQGSPQVQSPISQPCN